MDELLRQVGAILRAMWRHRWLGLAVAWVVGIIGSIVVMSVPDKYEASARIYVDTQSILAPLMAGLAIQPNVEQQVDMLSRTLISRPNVERLIRMADLDLKIKSKSDQEDLIDHLMKTLQIKSTGRDNLYTLSYRDPNPKQATRVVQSLTSIFVESNLGDKRKDSSSAKQFIEEQVKSYEKKLQDAEERLKEFRLRNIDLQLGEGKGLTDQAGDISSRLAQAKMDLHQAEDARDSLKRQLAGEDPVLLPDDGAAAAGVSIPDIDGRIDALKRNLDALLQRFTEQHPDVVNTRHMIKELEDQKKREIAARKKAEAANPGSSINSNPVYQQIKVALSEADANVASLRAKVGDYEGQYKRLADILRNQPQLEQELAQLNRDYDVNKKNYETLVARRESASLTGELDSTTGVVDFRLVDPPRASNSPVAPNRLLLLALALGASLGAGIASSFVASQLRPVFFDARGLREATGIPVLGVVSLIRDEAALKEIKTRGKRFLAGFLGLIGAFGSGMLVLLFMMNRAAG